MDLREALTQYGTELPGVPAIEMLGSLLKLKESLCEKLAERFGSGLQGLCHGVMVPDLKAIGCTMAQSERILMIAAIGRKMTAMEGRPPLLSSPADIYALMSPILAGKLQEEMWCLCLDSKNRLISKRMVTTGLADRSLVHAREAYRSAISLNAMRIALAHNHPSGDPTPSAYDIESTRMLAAAGRIVGIEILDHIVIGRPGISSESNPGYTSFRELGLMKSDE
jgi:DNA repair protein RadC